MINKKRLCILFLVSAMLFSGAGCASKKQLPADTNSLDSYVTIDTLPAETEEKIEILAAESDYFSFVSDPNCPEKPQFINPLSGLGASEDVSDMRPVAIMVNNIRAACPQVGISQGDIIYECLAEGGITRMLMLSNDYRNLEKVGSIRSSRPYYIDFAMSHDAIYVHAGGSEDAYAAISNRRINNLDGVRGAHATEIFYRDQERLKTMSLEHTMVSDGEKLVMGIDLLGYREEHTDDFVNTILTPDWGFKLDLEGTAANYIKIPYNPSGADTQIVEYEYDAQKGKYLRWQFIHEEHIDSMNGEQLAFDNIIIIKMPHVVTNDYYNHRMVDTVGEGSGYFITGGEMIEINWSKAGEDAEMYFTDINGAPLVINRGKTIINVVDDDVHKGIIIE
ncbi:MAG: DUF3048 domain-containing protein [Clostridia bacterium]|nr:DUF3048 domain-containing protein [Clostridia bacterium]